VAFPLNRFLESAAGRLGYRLRRFDQSPYGIEFWHDLQRVAKAWNNDLSVAFDVGANVGQTTAHLKKIWPRMSIVCFEPAPATFQELQRTIAPLPDVTAHNVALGAASGSFDLFTYRGNSQLASLAANAPFPARFSSTYDSRAEKVTCVVRTLDEVRRELHIERIALLKIDTEGFDLQVLQGARQSLVEGRIDFVYVEFNTLFPKEGTSGGALFPIADFLTPLGFTLISTYTDFVMTEGEFFGGYNALFARQAL
jgi:FkbM family methyltransferase